MNCEAGQFLNGTSGVCESCSPGSFSAVAGNESSCSLCSAGYYAPQEGATSCLWCDLYSYNSRSGASTCSSCKPHSQRIPEQEEECIGTSSSQCECQINFYNNTRGLCKKCPKGARCDGKAGSIPYADDGYWGDAKDSLSIFIACTPRSACNRGLSSSNSITSRCARGRIGQLCARLGSGYFGLGQQNQVVLSCPSSHVWSIVLEVCGVVFVFVCWWCLTRFTSPAHHSLLIFMQVCAICSRVALQWHSRLRWLAVVLSLVLFDVDVFAPHCTATIRTTWGYVSAFTLQLILPLLLSLLHALPVLWLIVRERLQSTSTGTAASQQQQQNQQQNHQQQQQQLMSTCWSSCGRCFRYTSAVVILACFEPLSCTRFPNGSHYLRWSGSVRCGSEQHEVFVIVSAVVLVLGSLGCIARVQWGRTTQLLVNCSPLLIPCPCVCC